MHWREAWEPKLWTCVATCFCMVLGHCHPSWASGEVSDVAAPWLPLMNLWMGAVGEVKEMMAVDRYDRKGQELMQMDGGDEAEGPEGGVAIWSGSRRKVQVSRESSASGWQDKVPCRLWGRGQLEGGYSCQEAGKH